jgi:hypothetical protein
MGWELSQSSVGLIGAQEPETARLPQYFSERGFSVHRWDTLIAAPRLGGVKHGIVVFAESFTPAQIVGWLKDVAKTAPRRLVIVLTATPGDFSGPNALRGENVVLLARPVLAWHLVDVIRNHIQRHVKGRA